MVVAQFTGVSLQKDDNAFCKFDTVSGDFKFASTIDNIHTDSEILSIDQNTITITLSI